MWSSVFFPLVLKYVPAYVGNSTSVLSHMVCPKFKSHVYKPQRWALLGEHLLYFAPGGPKRCFYGDMPNVPKEIVDEPINMAPLK
jgi:hypothetical protein